jgi:hypothetical protein
MRTQPINTDFFRTLKSKPSTITRCTCCNGEIKIDRPLVDLDSNLVSYHGHLWRVTPSMAVFLHTITQAWPRPASYYKIGVDLWGPCPPDTYVHRISVIAAHARYLLRPAGGDVCHVRPERYRLVLEGQSTPRGRRSGPVG